MYCHIFQNIVYVKVCGKIRSLIDILNCGNYPFLITVRNLAVCAVPDSAVAVCVIIGIIEVCAAVAIAGTAKVIVTALWIFEFFILAGFIRVSLWSLRSVLRIAVFFQISF